MLRHAERSAPPPSFDLPALDRRRRRRDVRRRLGTVAVGIGLTVVIAASAITLIRDDRAAISGATGSTSPEEEALLPPATDVPLVAAEGQYYYRAVLLAYHCTDSGTVCGGNDVSLDATFWWSPSDDSGRIAVDAREMYGLEEGRFAAGEFPNANGIDVSDFPLDADALTIFLLERSDASGSSPAPMVTPPPEGAPRDGQLWRAITDLLMDPHVTPAVRAALLEVAAELRGSHVTLAAVDPFGRPAHVIEFGNWGGELIERLYVDPSSHELLGWTKSAPGGEPFEVFVVQGLGVVSSTETAPTEAEQPIQPTLLSVSDLLPADES
jgi:hypothetical protein